MKQLILIVENLELVQWVLWRVVKHESVTHDCENMILIVSTMASYNMLNTQNDISQCLQISDMGDSYIILQTGKVSLGKSFMVKAY